MYVIKQYFTQHSKWHIHQCWYNMEQDKCRWMSQNWIKSQLLAGFGFKSNLYELSKMYDKHVFTIERHVRIFRVTAPVYITIHLVRQWEFTWIIQFFLQEQHIFKSVFIFVLGTVSLELVLIYCKMHIPTRERALKDPNQKINCPAWSLCGSTFQLSFFIYM